MDHIIKIAAQTMKISYADAERHCKKIPDSNAYYFWNPIRGGIAVIVDTNGEKLGAASSVSYERHLKAFLSGKRN